MMARTLILTLAAVLWVDIPTSWSRHAASPSPYIEDGLNYTVQQVNAGRKINNFGSYKDVVLTEYKVPPMTVSMIFGFATTSNPKGCSSDKNVTVFIQHGGFPIFPMNHARWPDTAFINRTDVMTLDFPATDVTWKLTKPVPRGGTYYSAVYIKEAAVTIKQKGLFSKCDIGYVSSFLTSAYVDPMIVLSPGEQRVVKAVAGVGVPAHQLFQMCLPEDHFDSVDVILNCAEGCPLTVRARSDGLPVVDDPALPVTSKVCELGLPCTISYTPIQKTCQYVYVEYGNDFFANDSHAVSYNISINPVKCQLSLKYLLRNVNMVAGPSKSLRRHQGVEKGQIPLAEEPITPISLPNISLAKQPIHYGQPQSCPAVLDMARMDVGPSFTSTFGLDQFTWPSVEYLNISASGYSETVFRFTVMPYKDTGGTLQMALNLTEAAAADIANLTIIACLSAGKSSRFDIENNCQGPVVIVNKTTLYKEILIPYPEIGVWEVIMQGHPSASSSAGPAVFVPLRLTLQVTQCVKGSCGPYGTCRIVLNSGILITSSCVCTAGYKGWDCQDDSEAESTAQLILAVVFLTVSNLMFIPAGIVAIRRKYFTEAVVYFSTCFFSSFYHACDQPLKQLSLCIMDYGVLQFCDFYVSILSFWVTIVAMADLPAYVRSIAHIAGCIGIALGVEYEKTGIWVFAVPALVALLILGVSWGFRSYRMNKVHPQKHYWLIHFVPGFVLAVLGLVLFAFVETKTNYKFVHSVWHVLMAAAVICFLPPARHRLDGKYPNIRAVGTDSDLSITASHLSQNPLVAGRGSDSQLSGIGLA